MIVGVGIQPPFRPRCSLQLLCHLDGCRLLEIPAPEVGNHLLLLPKGQPKMREMTENPMNNGGLMGFTYQNGDLVSFTYEKWWFHWYWGNNQD